MWVEDGLEACLGAIDGHRIDAMQLDAGSMTLMKEILRTELYSMEAWLSVDDFTGQHRI